MVYYVCIVSAICVRIEVWNEKDIFKYIILINRKVILYRKKYLTSENMYGNIIFINRDGDYSEQNYEGICF